jgi:hypothetical protein
VTERLAGFYHWNDREALEQAVLVAADRHAGHPAPVKAEGAAEKFRTFEAALSER